MIVLKDLKWPAHVSELATAELAGIQGGRYGLGKLPPYVDTSSARAYSTDPGWQGLVDPFERTLVADELYSGDPRLRSTIAEGVKSLENGGSLVMQGIVS
jgi:hypothetical protein